MKKKILFLFGDKDYHAKKLVLSLKKKVNLKVNFFSKKKKIKKLFNKRNGFYDFIFCFRSKYILSYSDIKKSKFPPINFHPGPPEYRGYGCVNFALYKNSKNYGITAHLINEKIDSGKIINVKRFKIKKKDNVSSLLKKTHSELFFMAKKTIFDLLKRPNTISTLLKKSKKEKWSKVIKSKKDLDKLYEIAVNSSQNEIKRKIRSTVYKHFKPYICLNKKKYYLE